jgi:hypothetical protein
MVFAIRRYHRTGLTGWVLVCLLVWAAEGRGEDFRLESVGVRGGFSTSSGQGFNQAETFANVNLPWGWDLGKRWHLQSQFDCSIGWLGDGGKNLALIGTVGPGGLLKREGLPLSLDGGVSPTFLSRSDFGLKDFGTDIQFTTHLGVNWDFAAHWRIGYRFQHMSNANLANNNPGLNTHLFALSYVF